MKTSPEKMKAGNHGGILATVQSHHKQGAHGAGAARQVGSAHVESKSNGT